MQRITIKMNIEVEEGVTKKFAVQTIDAEELTTILEDLNARAGVTLEFMFLEMGDEDSFLEINRYAKYLKSVDEEKYKAWLDVYKRVHGIKENNA